MGKKTGRKKQDRAKLKKHDWVIHYVANGVVCQCCGEVVDTFPEGICDAHTHGLNRYGHPELQIVIDIGPEDIGCILNKLGNDVRSGRKFADGEFVNGIFTDCPIQMRMVSDESGEPVLRVVIPDGNNVFPGDDGCEYPFSVQLLDTKRLYMHKNKEEKR